MEIKINGKKYKPNKPKAKAWRELMEFDETKAELDFIDYVDAHAEITAKSFGNAEVTAELLLENLEVDEILELYRKIMMWFCELLSKKLDQIPNEQTTAE